MNRKHPFVVGNIYHVYNRGVAKGAICRSEADFWRFLQGLCLFNDVQSTSSILWHLERNNRRLTMNVLKNYVVKEGKSRIPLVRILAYCVLGNHYHLLVEEIQEDGITKFMQKLGTGYTGYFNKKYERVGHLFQGRFKSILVDEERYLQYLLVYINALNPVEFVAPGWKERGIQNVAEALKFLDQYQFSSHLDYSGKRGSLILGEGASNDFFSTSKAYRSLVRAVLSGKERQDISHIVFE